MKGSVLLHLVLLVFDYLDLISTLQWPNIVEINRYFKVRKLFKGLETLILETYATISDCFLTVDNDYE